MDNEQAYQLIQDVTQFLEDWRNGVSNAEYSDFSELIDPNFTMIMYNGILVDQSSLEQIMTMSFGTSNVKISIESFRSRDLNDLTLSTYVEKHQYEDRIERSYVSVLLDIKSMQLLHMQVTTVLI